MIEVKVRTPHPPMAPPWVPPSPQGEGTTPLLGERSKRQGVSGEGLPKNIKRTHVIPGLVPGIYQENFALDCWNKSGNDINMERSHSHA